MPPKTLKIGILGDGQLARMLAQSAHSLGVTPVILSPNADSPAGLVSSQRVSGSFEKWEDVTKIFNECDSLIFESEFVPADILSRLLELQAQFPEKNIYPSPQVISLLQDRRTQKDLLKKHKIPTSDFVNVSDEQDLRMAVKKLGLPLVLKKHLGGYDGYGTSILQTDADIQSFLQNKLSGNHFIAEKWVRFQRELAVIFARNAAGEIVTLPFVETKQVENRCDWVAGPLQSKKASKLLNPIKSMLKKIDYIGVIAFELFETDKQVLVNEVAPRVHNSGHYSMQALHHSQFTLHILCGISVKLPKMNLNNKNFVMTNLLGPQDGAFNLSTATEGCLHWYGKKESRPGRKMGHINYTGNDPLKKLLARALKERQKLLGKK